MWLHPGFASSNCHQTSLISLYYACFLKPFDSNTIYRLLQTISSVNFFLAASINDFMNIVASRRVLIMSQCDLGWMLIPYYAWLKECLFIQHPDHWDMIQTTQHTEHDGENGCLCSTLRCDAITYTLLRKLHMIATVRKCI